jgi:hypothetical protein
MKFTILLIILISFHSVKNETKDSLLYKFFENYVKADKDDIDYYIKQFNSLGYTDLEQLFGDSEALSHFYYLNKRPEGYIVSFPNKTHFLYSIFVN